MQFEKKCQERRRAGLPLEFSLPTRTGRDALQASPVSTLRCLYAHRKSCANLEFKKPKWEHEQFYLHIHVRGVRKGVEGCMYESNFASLTPQLVPESGEEAVREPSALHVAVCAAAGPDGSQAASGGEWKRKQQEQRAHLTEIKFNSRVVPLPISRHLRSP